MKEPIATKEYTKWGEVWKYKCPHCGQKWNDYSSAVECLLSHKKGDD
jgi:hypothetical protein